jgi:molybdate transport system regulatory protein
MVPRRRKASRRLGLQGSVWIAVGDQTLGGSERFGLLRAVASEGSITKAAKAYGISYRAAWTALDAMNTLAGEALVERSVGGRGGGSTRLTPHGRELIDRFEQIDAAHQRFLKLLDDQSIDFDKPFSLLSVLNMKTSARNQFVGTVTRCARRRQRRGGDHIAHRPASRRGDAGKHTVAGTAHQDDRHRAAQGVVGRAGH